MSGRNWLLRPLLIDQIQSDPQWCQGNYIEQPVGARRAWEFFSAATNGGTQALQSALSHPDKADEWLRARRALPFEADANDLIYQIAADVCSRPTCDDWTDANSQIHYIYGNSLEDVECWNL